MVLSTISDISNFPEVFISTAPYMLRIRYSTIRGRLLGRHGLGNEKSRNIYSSLSAVQQRLFHDVQYAIFSTRTRSSHYTRGLHKGQVHVGLAPLPSRGWIPIRQCAAPVALLPFI